MANTHTLTHLYMLVHIRPKRDGSWQQINFTPLHHQRGSCCSLIFSLFITTLPQGSCLVLWPSLSSLFSSRFYCRLLVQCQCVKRAAMWNNSQNVIISLDFAQRQRRGRQSGGVGGGNQEQSDSCTQKKSNELWPYIGFQGCLMIIITKFLYLLDLSLIYS